MTGAWPRARAPQAAWHYYGAALASTVLWLGCASSPSTDVLVACEVFHPQITDLPTRGISAHRGGRLGCPVNTIGAFQRAICQGVHQIELDVRATADAEIVVVHDDRVTDGQGRSLRISESTLSEVQSLLLEPCAGEMAWQRIPTFEEALDMMPHNVWINVDIKENDPLVGKLIAETVATAHRFHQIIFGVRNHTRLAVRHIAEGAGAEIWVANMSRQILRRQYIETTITSCDDFIQLSFRRGRPSGETINFLKQAGVRVNYSWLRNEDENQLRRELGDLFDRGVDFVLVDHVGPAMEAISVLGISPVVPRWNGTAPFSCTGP